MYNLIFELIQSNLTRTFKPITLSLERHKLREKCMQLANLFRPAPPSQMLRTPELHHICSQIITIQLPCLSVSFACVRLLRVKRSYQQQIQIISSNGVPRININ